MCGYVVVKVTVEELPMLFINMKNEICEEQYGFVHLILFTFLYKHKHREK